MPEALLELLPQILLGVILLSFAMSYAAGRGLLVLWDRTFGQMLIGIAAFMNWSKTIFGHHIGFDFGRVFLAANTGVKNRIEKWIAGSEEGMARTIRAMTAVWKAGIVATEWLAKETGLGFEWLLHVHLPRWAKVALAPLLLPFLLPKLIRAIMPHVRTVIVKPIHVIERTLPGRVTVIVRRVGAVALPGALGIPHIWKEIHGLTKRNLRLAHRLHRLEGLLGAAAFAGLMANALGLGTNWRCITRGNIGKVARRLCGLSPAALEDLLGLIADVVIVADICRVIELLTEGLTLIEGPINTFVGVVDGALCHGDYSAPPALPAMALSLPPSVSLSLSLP